MSNVSPNPIRKFTFKYLTRESWEMLEELKRIGAFTSDEFAPSELYRTDIVTSRTTKSAEEYKAGVRQIIESRGGRLINFEELVEV